MKEEILRNLRNSMLQSCDWTDLPNAPLTEEEKILWQQYRQQLRDFPSVVNYAEIDLTSLYTLENVNWPTPPND